MQKSAHRPAGAESFAVASCFIRHSCKRSADGLLQKCQVLVNILQSWQFLHASYYHRRTVVDFQAILVSTLDAVEGVGILLLLGGVQSWVLDTIPAYRPRGYGQEKSWTSEGVLAPFYPGRLPQHSGYAVHLVCGPVMVCVA